MAGFSKMKMKNTKAFLKGYANKLASLLKIEVGRPRKRGYKSGRSFTSPLNATGHLRNSIKAKHSKVRSVLAAYDVVGAGYALDIQNGSKETPLVADLENWIRKKPVQLRTRSGRIQKKTGASITKYAENVSKAISRNGTLPVPFITDAMQMGSKMLSTIASPIAEDIVDDIEIFLKNVGYDFVNGKFQVTEK